MTRPSVTQKCTYSPHSGPVGCLPTPNIFTLANEFAKGKMFWNLALPNQLQLRKEINKKNSVPNRNSLSFFVWTGGETQKDNYEQIY